MAVTIASLDDALADARGFLEETALPAFLQRQRWFGGKARSLAHVTLLDWHCLRKSEVRGRKSLTNPIPSGGQIYFMLLQARYADGVSEQYFLPLVLRPASASQELNTGRIVAELETPLGPAVLADAVADDDACVFFLAAIEEQAAWTTQTGKVRALPSSEFPAMRGDASEPLAVRLGTAEQSNSNIRYGERLIMKVFRRCESGPNPDFEISRFLTERTTFQRVPRLAGGWLFEPRDPVSSSSRFSEPTTLAMLQGWVANNGNAWELALDHLSRAFERLAQNSPDVATTETNFVAEYEQYAKLLGQRTAELHLALASEAGDPDFCPEPLSADDLDRVSARMRDHLAQVCPMLRGRLRDFPAGTRQQAEQLLSAEAGLSDRLTTPPLTEPLTKIRCHGDYHLGQVLVVMDEGGGMKDEKKKRSAGSGSSFLLPPSSLDFVILDFEGEPTRPLAERRAKYSPLKDVAGMCRSFHYAAYAALFQQPPERRLRLESWADAWQRLAATAFLAAYRATAAAATFLPKNTDLFRHLLDLYLLEKALYELHYELNNRPDWVAIPIQGLLAILRTA